MKRDDFSLKRNLILERLSADLIVVGGGISGVCAAVTSARQGLKVVLVQDRPVLGGNSSSEVRLWILGATSHMGNNNRWAREGGLIDEILVENTYRNREGNPLIFDVILLEKVKCEANITLLLNTAVYDLEKRDADSIANIKAFCSQNSKEYLLHAPLYCDASGDGIMAFLAGASFRMGAESSEEFGEKFAPSSEYGELLGHSLYFYSKDTGKPVQFIPPAFALNDIKKIPRFRSFNAKEYGCKLWWLEYGGRLDTVNDTEEIKWELWKVVYGVWNYIKNSGEFPEAENLTLEWVGTIPGKRESRRFEGEYMLRQQNIIEQHLHDDAVAYGGWSIDLHPADGVFSEKPGCNQWHSKGIYQIPYRCLYSKNIKNLFLAGRIISATHVAFASSRVMGTCAHIGQAVGMAASIAAKNNIYPGDIIKKDLILELQSELLKSGQYIPGLVLSDKNDLVQKATITASSEFSLNGFQGSKISKPLDISSGQILPLEKGRIPVFTIYVESDIDTNLEVELRISSKVGNYTPDLTLEQKALNITPGNNSLDIKFVTEIEKSGYAFLIFKKNPSVKLCFSNIRISGILSVFNLVNKAVSNFGKQTPETDIGVEEFEFWCPQRRPNGENIALSIVPAIHCFQATNVSNGVDRPTDKPNVWVAALEDSNPHLHIEWIDTQQIGRVELFFDTDYDHPMETVLMGHPENVMPFCVRDFYILDDKGQQVYEETNNYQTRNTIDFVNKIYTKSLTLHVKHPFAHIPAAIFTVRCYA